MHMLMWHEEVHIKYNVKCHIELRIFLACFDHFHFENSPGAKTTMRRITASVYYLEYLLRIQIVLSHTLTLCFTYAKICFQKTGFGYSLFRLASLRDSLYTRYYRHCFPRQSWKLKRQLFELNQTIHTRLHITYYNVITGDDDDAKKYI